MRSRERSSQWLARAERLIPMATQTLSKGPSQFVQGVAPIYLQRGAGSHVWDVDGNEFIDFPMGLGPILLGHAEPAVDDAIRAQLADGITFTLMHPLEVEVAERIAAACPGVEAVRFAKSGSDAVSAAVRAARALTGRDHVLVGGYHGWHDWFIGSTTRNRGVPAGVRELTHTFRFNDLADLERVLGEHRGSVAAVVLEPSAADVPHDGYLRQVVELTHQHGALCIFDEIITGFRIALGGARERYDVIPDYSCYGKALGNGMPISAVAGSWDTMRIFEEVFFSATHGGEALSLAAARAVLDVLAEGDALAHIEQLGKQMRTGLDALVDRHAVADEVVIGGEPQRTVVGFKGARELLLRSWVQQCLLDRGALFNGSMFICARHTDDEVAVALDGFDTAFAAIATGADLAGELRGPPVQPVFRTP